MSRRIGLCVSVSSCPYVFTTQGVASLPTSSDPSWSSAWTLARGWLDVREAPRWEEQCEPLEGELRVSQLTFTLHDRSAETGVASGYALLSRLTTRLPNTIVRTRLASSIDRDDLVIEVERDPGFGTGSRVVWIEGEAILCSSFNPGTGEFSVTTRGYYGSKATAHRIDASTGSAATLWAEMPFARRRKAIFWWVDLDTNVATRLWTGVCGRTPRLGSRSAAQVELQCDSLAQVMRELPLGMSSGRCTLTGWTRYLVQLIAGGINAQDTTPNDETLLFPTLQLAAESQRQRLLTKATDLGVTLFPSFSTSGETADWTVQRQVGATETVLARGVLAGGGAEAVNADGTTGLRTATAHFDKVPPIALSVAAALDRATGVDLTRPLGVDNIAGLPATWPATTSPDDGATTARVLLRGEYSDDTWLEVYPTEPGVAAIPYVRATAARFPKKPVAATTTGPRVYVPEFIITTPVSLAVTTHVHSPHWLQGLRYGVLADLSDSLGDLLDAGDWDWTDFGRAIGLTPGPLHARDWYLDGETKLGAILSDACKLSGCGFGMRNGKLSVFALQPPLEDQPVVASLTSADFVAPPQWSAWPDGLANYMKFDGELVKATVAMADSIGKYGPGRSLGVSLKGVPAEAVLAATPSELLGTALARVVGLWSEPTALVTLTLTHKYLFETPIAIGDYVRVTEWLLPDGTGARGLTNRIVQVTGVAPDLKGGTLTITALDWYRPGLAGWSPACRVASIDGGVLTIKGPATGYANGSDYARSDALGYRYTPNDGGVGWFAETWAVRLRRWGTTTPTEFATTVASVNPNTLQIVIGDVPGATWEGYAADGIVDLVFDHYSATVTDQRPVGGWVSSEADHVIDGTEDPPQYWSP